jgi:hypothetical protein
MLGVGVVAEHGPAAGDARDGERAESVHLAVVVAAEGGEVVDDGLAVVGPVDDVVDVAGEAAAVGMCAAELVADWTRTSRLAAPGRCNSTACNHTDVDAAPSWTALPRVSTSRMAFRRAASNAARALVSSRSKVRVCPPGSDHRGVAANLFDAPRITAARPDGSNASRSAVIDMTQTLDETTDSEPDTEPNP